MRDDNFGTNRRFQPNLTELNIKDTNLSKEGALFLAQMLVENTRLCKVNLELNTNVPSQVYTDVTKNCKRNRLIDKDSQLPKA